MATKVIQVSERPATMLWAVRQEVEFATLSETVGGVECKYINIPETVLKIPNGLMWFI